ncbi:casein kinase 1 [Gracilaria domingensis]|nr:casein kinase 1 [Gracilaria domingensis]
MGIDRGVAHGARKVIHPLAVGNVAARFGQVSPAGGQPQVNHEEPSTGVDDIVLRVGTEEVLRLDVAVHITLGVQLAQELDAFVANYRHGIPGQTAGGTALQQPLQRGSQQIHDHDIIATVVASVVHPGGAVAVHVAHHLPLATRNGAGSMLEFDGDLLGAVDVLTHVDIAKVAGSEVSVFEDDVATRALADLERDGVLSRVIVHGERRSRRCGRGGGLRVGACAGAGGVGVGWGGERRGWGGRKGAKGREGGAN